MLKKMKMTKENKINVIKNKIWLQDKKSKIKI